MADRRRGGRLPDPSRMVDRAAEAAGDAGDLGAELLSTGVDAVTSLIGGLTSAPEEVVKAPRRRANQGSGATGAKRVGATVKRAAKTMARENRKTARTEATAAKKAASGARKTARTAVKSSTRAAKSVTRTSKSSKGTAKRSKPSKKK